MTRIQQSNFTQIRVSKSIIGVTRTVSELHGGMWITSTVFLPILYKAETLSHHLYQEDGRKVSRAQAQLVFWGSHVYTALSF